MRVVRLAHRRGDLDEAVWNPSRHPGEYVGSARSRHSMINSVLKAVDLLMCFTAAEPRLSLAELSRRLGTPKSSTHHLLATLQARGLVEKVDADRYALGMALIPLTQTVRVNAEVRDRASPLLRELADACRESVYLTVLDGDRSLYIYAVESSQRLVARTAIGDRVPMHCTSVGKATLAALDAEQVEDIITSVGLQRFTPTTITDPEMLRQDLARTRTRGYAIDNQEHEPGTFCVAAAIHDDHGMAAGAISVSGSDPEIIRGRLDALSGSVIRTAFAISARLGFVPARPAQIGGIAVTHQH